MRRISDNVSTGRAGCGKQWALVALALVCAAPPGLAAEPAAVSGTTGTPLGGFGAGGIKFKASDGTFAAMVRPPADAYDFQKVAGAKLALSVRRGNDSQSVDALKAVVRDGRPDDDAAWPTHRVNAGTVSDVEARLLAFSPLDRVDRVNMSLPCVFYELTLTNRGTSAARVDCTLGWDFGEQPPTVVPGKGLASPTWAVLAAGGGPGATVDTGSAPRTTVNSTLGPGEKAAVRFVVAWYNRVDPEIAFYQSVFKDPQSAAEHGMARFETFKANATSLVERMRASNLPAWLKNQTLNTLVNLTTNSMFKKDGRLAFAEGQWTCFGTMDQMWHARQIVNELLPAFAWQELRYWARTQRKDGQIHHDFNKMDGGKDKATRSALVDWDDTEHKDYRNIDKWVDLNCAFIVSVYETYRATGDKTELRFHWPYVKKAAQRVLDQVQKYGSKTHPYTFEKSENSYDAGGEPNPYNASLSAVAYKVMVLLAREQGEADVATTYQTAYDTVVPSFRARYLNGGFATGKHCEGFFAGQWLALHLKLGQIWTADETDRVLGQLDDYYHPYYWGLGTAKGTYDEWTPYILVHYGGLLLNTKRANQWQAMQRDAYVRQYDDANKVFAHPLDVLPKPTTPKLIADDVRSKKQYISMPALWRNYYDIVGYHRDASTQTLWLTPVLPDELNHRLTAAFYVSPEGDGTIDCVESGDAFQNQEITFKPDQPVPVKELRVADRYGQNVTATVNGKPCAVVRTGSGYARELRIDWRGTVGSEGLKVVVRGDPGLQSPPLPAKPAGGPPDKATTPGGVDAFAVFRAADAPKSAGTSVVDGKITSCNNFDYIQFDRVDFGREGATGFTAKVQGLAKDVTIEIVLDSVSGDSIGSCVVPAPGSPPQWADARCSIKKTSGVHDVFLKFSGSSPDDLVHIDTFQFVKAAAK